MNRKPASENKEFISRMLPNTGSSGQRLCRSETGTFCQKWRIIVKESRRLMSLWDPLRGQVAARRPPRLVASPVAATINLLVRTFGGNDEKYCQANPFCIRTFDCLE